MSDKFGPYAELEADNGFDHEMVNHSLGFVDPYDHNIHTNRMEGLYSHVKKDINRDGGCPDAELQERLDAWAFRHCYLKKTLPRDDYFHLLASVIGKYWRRAKAVVALS